MKPKPPSNSKKILLIGANGNLCLQLCRSLGQAGYYVAFLRFSETRSVADHSRFCAQSLYIGSPDANVSDYSRDLTHLLDTHHFDYLMPLDSLACELVYFAYDAISSLTCIVGPSPEAFTVIKNQYDALSAIESDTFLRPKTTLVKQGTVPTGFETPCVVKPVFSCAYIGDELQVFSVRKVSNADELDAKLRDDTPRSDVMLQMPVSGRNLEFNFCAVNGGLLGASLIQQLHEFRRGKTTSYRTAEQTSPQILEDLNRIARQLSWTGFMTIEAKDNNGCLYIMRVRPWPTDSISASVLSGVDFPKLLLDGLQGVNGREVALPVREAYARHLLMDVGWLFSQLKKGGARIAFSWLGSLKQVLTGSERFDIERFDDPMPAIRQFQYYLKPLVGKLNLHLCTALRRITAHPYKGKSINKNSALLIVCKGNINRSMVAEQLFKAKGFANVSSAGLLNMSGRKPSKQAETFISQKLGIDTACLRSSSVPRALRKAINVDLVLCFEHRHVIELEQRYPPLRGKICLISELALNGQGVTEIADPHGKSAESYSTCFQTIEALVEQISAVNKCVQL